MVTQDPEWSDLIFARGKIYPGKGLKISQRAKRKFWGHQVSFGTKFIKFGPKRANLATLCETAKSRTPFQHHLCRNKK